MILREAHEGEDIGFRLVHERGELRHFRTQLIGDLAPLLARGLGVVLNESCANECGHHATALAAGMGEHVAHEVHAWQRCHEACNTLPMAASIPSWASEITSLTPSRPRRASLR